MNHKNYKCSQKGVATTAGTVMVIVIFLIFFGIYVYMANNQMNVNFQLNLETLEAYRLKSAFFHFNQSLGTTWFISVVQSVFMAADESIGCGYDDGVIPKGYWYFGREDRDRDFYSANFTDFLASSDKYNAFGANPQICYPRDSSPNHITDYIRSKLSDGGFLDVKTLFEANGVEYQIGKTSPVLTLYDKEVNSTFIQKISLKSGSGTIEAATRNDNMMRTSLKLMAAAGRSAVQGLLGMGDAFYGAVTFAIHYMPFTPNAEAYKRQTRGTLENLIKASNQNQQDVGASVTFHRADLVAANDKRLPRFDGKGLVLFYNLTTRYFEKGTGAVASIAWPTESRLLTSCFGYRTDPLNADQNKFHSGIDIAAQLGAQNIVAAAASGEVADMYDKCTEGDAECGTRRGYGNFVMINHGDFYSFYAHLESVSVAIGDFVETGEAIGVIGNTGRSTGLHLHFEIRKDAAEDPCGYMDCSLSTQKICTPLLASSTHYYEDGDEFVKRPVTLEVSAQDYLPVLDCGKWISAEIPVVGFNYDKNDDMACCAGYLFSCDVQIDGLYDRQQFDVGEGTSVVDVGNSDVTDPRVVCRNLLRGGSLECRADGFKVCNDQLSNCVNLP